jgi:hypothetical protein
VSGSNNKKTAMLSHWLLKCGCRPSGFVFCAEQLGSTTTDCHNTPIESAAQGCHDHAH